MCRMHHSPDSNSGQQSPAACHHRGDRPPEVEEGGCVAPPTREAHSLLVNSLSIYVIDYLLGELQAVALLNKYVIRWGFGDV
jgi:hypothetical protein